jgi:hypothetical protein
MAGAKVTVKDVDLGWGELRKELATAAGGVYGKAGIIGAKGEAEHKGEGEDAALTNAELALIHEFGLGVPERSFLRAAFDKNHPKYLEHLQKLVRAVYGGKMTIERALGLVSQEAASDMRNLIRTGAGVPPPNSPATIARKGSSRPLVDTGQLINSITGAVVRGGAGEE